MKTIKVKTVKKIGVKQTYNLRMKAPYHNYILGNGLVSANSHSTSYAHLTYTTAWLKKYYPVEFMTALLRWEKDKDKLGDYLAACMGFGIKVVPPDINKSDLSFTTDGKDIVFGFAEIKNVGIPTAEEIIEKRPYNDVVDFLYKVDNKKVTKKHLKPLSDSGCFLTLHDSRKVVSSQIESLNELVRKVKKEKAKPPCKTKYANKKRQQRIEDMEERLEVWIDKVKNAPKLPEYEPEEIIVLEREYMNYNITLDELDLPYVNLHREDDAKPITLREFLYNWGALDQYSLANEINKTKHKSGGVVLEVRTPIVKKAGFWQGKKLMIVRASDISNTGVVEVFVSPDRVPDMPGMTPGDVIAISGWKVDHQLRISDRYDGGIRVLKSAQ